MDAVLEVLRSTSFIEKSLLLFLGGAATGFFFPIVKGAAERRATREVMLVEARANTSQEIARLLWQYYYLALREAYSGSNCLDSELKAARKDFNTTGWDVLKDVRSMIGGARWLLKKEQHIMFVAEYKAWSDTINEAEPGEDCEIEEWGVFQDMLLSHSAPDLDRLLGILADSFGLPAARQRFRSSLKRTTS